MSEDHLNNNKMAMPTAGRESLELVKTVGTGENLSVQMLTKMVMVMFYLVACRWFPSIQSFQMIAWFYVNMMPMKITETVDDDAQKH